MTLLADFQPDVLWAFNRLSGFVRRYFSLLAVAFRGRRHAF
jgi:hypothetical protein